MADDPLINALLRRYDDYEAPTASGDQNSLGYALAGPAPPMTTADIIKRYAPPNALSYAADHAPINEDHALSLVNALHGYLASADNWTRGRPTERDMLAPPGVPTAGSPAAAAGRAVGTAAGDRTLDALSYHLRQISHDEGGWPSRIGKAAFASAPLAVEGAFAPFQGGSAPWMLGTAGATTAATAYAFLKPHYDMLMRKREYLRAMDARQAERAGADLPKSDSK